LAARRESRENMGVLIASSLQRIRGYSAKLETVEREWVRANDLVPLLSTLKENLMFDQLDPTKRAAVNGYEADLRKAIDQLSQAKSEANFGPLFDPQEVQSILALFR